MSKPYVYVTRWIPDAGTDLLRASCEVRVNPHDRPLTREELFTEIAEADGVLGLLHDRIDAAFFDAAPKLKGYANYAVGFDNIDVPEATRRKLPVSNTPDVLTLATAELAWTLLFAVARRVVEADAVMRSGTWPGLAPNQFISADVSGKTLGIVGAGRIGSAMARMSKGFGMRVLYCQRSANPALEQELGAKRVDFDTLLAESDFVSIHTPLTPDTRHMFGAEAFAKMKRTAILINTGRGPTIDEAALVQALRAGAIAGAGLDVYEFEPKMVEGLAELKNVTVLPHIGSATASSRNGMAELAARNLLAMLEGKRPPTCLNPELYG
jgi:glyoxylate reductase